MSRTPQREEVLRGVRSVLLLVILTAWSSYSLVGGVPQRAHGHAGPHGNPLVYSLAASWLISITIAFASSALFFRVNPRRFSLARWEREGALYDRAGVRAFRWVLLHSPLGWINPNFHWRGGRADCERLLREMNSGEGVHWLTCAASVALATWNLADGHAVYGYAMLLVQDRLRSVASGIDAHVARLASLVDLLLDALAV